MTKNPTVNLALGLNDHDEIEIVLSITDGDLRAHAALAPTSAVDLGVRTIQTACHAVWMPLVRGLGLAYAATRPDADAILDGIVARVKQGLGYFDGGENVARAPDDPEPSPDLAVMARVGTVVGVLVTRLRADPSYSLANAQAENVIGWGDGSPVVPSEDELRVCWDLARLVTQQM